MMNINKDKVSYLFNRYYEKTATDNERKELFLLLKDLSNDELSDLVSQSYYNLNVTEFQANELQALSEVNKILAKESVNDANIIDAPVIPLWRKIAVAASILFVISFGLYVYKHAAVKQNIVATKTDVKQEILPGSNKATLTLGDGTTILLDNASEGTLTKLGNIEINKTKDGQVIYSVKAGNSNQVSQTNKIATPRGGQYQVVLPDGSKAWLNAASSISFPTLFNKDKREISITGEVYLEVAKKPSPFIVKSQKGLIQVLGTHFNVMAYEDERFMETTLLEGSIKLSSDNTSKLLNPGQQAQLTNTGDIQVSITNVDEAIAWKTGLFSFQDAEVQTVMRQISRWYDVDISYNGKIPHKQITGKISRNAKISEVLSMLNYTGLNFKIEDKKIIVIE